MVIYAPTSVGERIEEVGSAILSAAPQRFSIVGHGFGAMVGLEILRRAQDRVDRFALVCSTPMPATPQEAADRELRLVAAKAGRFKDVIAEEFPASSIAAGPSRSDFLSRIAAMGEANGVEAYLRQCRAMQKRRDAQRVLAQYQGPVLLLCGSEDPLFPRKRQLILNELIATSHLETIEGAGHFPMIEQPSKFISVLENWIKTPVPAR